jgi:hypothetical protein
LQTDGKALEVYMFLTMKCNFRNLVFGLSLLIGISNAAPFLPVPDDQRQDGDYWFKGKVNNSELPQVSQGDMQLYDDLSQAIKAGSFEKTKELGSSLKARLGSLDFTPGVAGRNRSLVTSIFGAPESSRLAIVKWVIEVGGASPEMIAEDGTPLMVSVAMNDIAVTEYLLNKKAAVYSRSYYHAHDTVLSAIAHGHLEMVKLFIRRKIITSAEYMTPGPSFLFSLGGYVNTMTAVGTDMVKLDSSLQSYYIPTGRINLLTFLKEIKTQKSHEHSQLRVQTYYPHSEAQRAKDLAKIDGEISTLNLIETEC